MYVCMGLYNILSDSRVLASQIRSRALAWRTTLTAVIGGARLAEIGTCVQPQTYP
jgi:hypothetical protein